MSLTVECNACARRYNVADNWAGKRVKCKNCGAVMQVPAPPAESSPGDNDPPDIDALLSGGGGLGIGSADAPPPPIPTSTSARAPRGSRGGPAEPA